MTISSFSVELQGSEETLFDYLGDPRNRMAWQSSLLWLKLSDEAAPPGIGVSWREKAKGFGEFEMEISEFQRPTRWAEKGHSKKGSMSLDLDFAPAKRPGFSQVTVTVNLELHGLLGSLSWAAKALLQPLMSADLRKAARLARKP